ncbi:tRNA (adenine(22)-N(1))-methyltransferase [Oceanobacillus rekensis]|uniref:tRNA (adenine(22)-N(1))-methyltransferase n=1 Tax=Oceanobacillus rekensis TaxID=937927 RepID=UPI000B433132|nr:class I SAM-dependent methyltransferase [Oceanobacillus rekensis]
MINKLKLSNRLLKVSSYIPNSAYFADIGSDHAYLPCHVCLSDPTAKAIAGEVNKGPFESAKSTIDNYHLKERVEVRLGNGLEILKENEVNHIVIAGMGGSLIKAILEEGKSKLLNVERIIAQPNVDARNIRRWFLENGYVLTNEAIVEENEHIYEILVADKDSSKQPYSDEYMEKELLFGPLLMKSKSAAFHKKWTLEHKKLASVIRQMKSASVPDSTKITLYENELAWMEEVLHNEKQDLE